MKITKKNVNSPWRLFHEIDDDHTKLESGVQNAVQPCERRTAERILAAFELSKDRMEKRGSTIWKGIEQKHHQEFLGLLTKGDPEPLMEFFDTIHRSSVLYGIDNNRIMYNDPDSLRYQRAVIHDRLVRLAEALGCMPLEVPPPSGVSINARHSPDVLVYMIERKLRINISPPKVGGGRQGLLTERGDVYYHRDVSSLYAAHRVRSILKGTEEPRICEIGGGMGRIALYCHRMGGRDYTLVDLPHIAAIQAFFLLTALGQDSVALDGEASTAPIRVLPAWRFPELDDSFDLVVNTSSMPEMGSEIAYEYIEEMAKKKARAFFSINQEGQAGERGGPVQCVIWKIIKKEGSYERVFRHPYWLLHHFAEELYVLKNPL